MANADYSHLNDHKSLSSDDAHMTGLLWFSSLGSCQSFRVSTTNRLPAFPGNTVRQHLLAWEIIVDTNTNHVPSTALPALQPIMTFPVHSRNILHKSAAVGGGEEQTKWTTRASTTCQTNRYYGRREWESVGENSDVKNDLLIIHYLPALLMRWRLLNN